MKKHICLVLVALLLVIQGLSPVLAEENVDGHRRWRPRFRAAIRNGIGIGHIGVPDIYIPTSGISYGWKDGDWVPGGEATIEFPVFNWLVPEISYVIGYIFDSDDGGRDWELWEWVHGVGAGVKFYLELNRRLDLWADIKGNYYRVLRENHAGIGAGVGLDMKSVGHNFAIGPSINYDHIFVPGENIKIISLGWNFRF
jgi:hypothetical protein